jgi:uncharacterized protein YfaS (alpha-2-macroglobulin family)
MKKLFKVLDWSKIISMRRFSLYISLILFTTIILVIGQNMALADKPSLQKIYRQSDEQFKNHNYAEALVLYRQLVKETTDKELKKKTGLKIMETLKLLKHWDELITENEQYLKNNPDSLSQARAYAFAARMYQEVPHEGYKRNGKVFRDTTVREGEYTWLYADDQKTSLEDYQKAKKLYYRQKPGKDINKEVIALNFNFAEFLQYGNGYYGGPIPLEDDQADVQEQTAYNPKADIKDQIIFLYDEIIELNKQVKDPHNNAMAIFKKAHYFVNKYGIGKDFETETDKTIKKENPLPLLWEIVNKYTDDPLAPEALIGIAQIHAAQNDLKTALEIYETFLRKFPKSTRVSDAKAEIQSIKSKSLTASVPGIQKPGVKAKINLSAKNIKEVSIKVYSVDLVNILKNNSNEPNTQFNNFQQNFAEKISGARQYYKKKVASLTVLTGDKGDYQFTSKEVELPLSETGTYLVEVNGDTVTTLSLLIISELTIVKNMDKNKALVYILDRETGNPLRNANVLVKEHYYEYQNGYSGYKSITKEGVTDQNGLFVYERLKTENNSNSYIDVLAWKDKHVSFSDAQYYYGYYQQNKIYKSFVYTDRPVYRPEQTINFKEIIRLYESGKNINVENEKVKIKISNPKGESVYEKELTTNQFGTVNDSFKLAKGADLGVYYIYTTIADGNIGIEQSSGQNFRVEEYKKPEYVVNVKSEQSQLKPGNKAKVKINATYYFGSPVAGANVHYKVMRTPYYYYYYRPGPYDWLYGSEYGKIYNEQYQATGTVWKEGDLVTDSEGNVSIEFDTEKVSQDYRYDILADVVDKSRRDIKGAGSIKVTQTAFYAFVEMDQGFYTPGENAGVEINLRNPDDQPVKAAGVLKVYKVKYSGKNDEVEDPVQILSEKLESNAEGRIFYKWRVPSAGYYKVVFETMDKEEKPVKGERYVWVAGDNYSDKHYKDQNIELLTDKRTYEEGDTARIMIHTNYPDSYVMLFTETDNSILSNKAFHMTSSAKVFEIKIGKQHVPNFNIKAALISKNQLFMATREIFVPPANQFMNVEISTKKDTYLPGEKTTIQVKTTDNKGRPVSAEVALGVTDSSLYYIQEDVSGDIKTYYYGQRRYFQNFLYTSLNTYLYTMVENREKLDNYPRHPGPFNYNYGYYADDLKDGLSIKESDSFAGEAANEMSADRSAAKPALMAKTESRRAENAPVPQASALGTIEKKADIKQLQQAEIRSYFPDTALWKPTVVTNSKGLAQVEIKFPDSVTTWRATANAIDQNSKVGGTKENIITRKNLLVRLQAPRFFMERDEIVLSAVVNNDLATEKEVVCSLELGDQVENTEPQQVTVTVPAKGEKRVDWKVKVKKEGSLKITLKALTDEESDAVQMSFPVYVHGIDKYVAQNGIIKTSGKKDLPITVPAARRKGATTLNLTFAPSMITTMIEALPYLAVYPYGCVEQTTSRFIPTVLVAKTLKNMGIDLSQIENKEKSLDPQELAKWLDKKNHNPVYNNSEIDNMVKSGLERLYTFQNSDGGFGWWSGFSSDTYMSAYVIHGLLLARDSDYQVDASVLARGLGFLSEKYSARDEDQYNNIYIAYVLSMDKKIKESQLEPFFKQRDDLNNYGKALLSLAYANLGNKARAELITQNLKSFAVIDKAEGTASWKNEQRWYWYWYGDRIETNAFILKAFLKSRPNDEVVPMLAKWLVLNRKGNHWYSTKDTANTIYALSDYAKVNKELAPNYTITVLYNGEPVKKVKVNKDNMLTFDNKLILTDKELKDGSGKITIVKEGNGNLYYSAYLEYFSLEEDIKGAGNNISVKREYYKLTERKDENKNIVYDKQLISYNETLKSGDLVEVKLTLKANNDYEYLIFEDMKPAGFEATDLKSGYIYQNGVYLNRELRDEKVVFFMNNFPQGTQVLTYQLRAEIPGKFHALPHKTYAMYAPEVRAISDEMRIGVVD